MHDAAEAAAFILAGGKSTRMGTDKALLQFGGQTLLATALEIARSLVPQVQIVGPATKFAAFAPTVEDTFADAGPLGGIHAALQSSKYELNLILAVDLPFLSSDLLRYLVSRARASSAVVTVPRTGGRWQPLCAVYRRQFAQCAETALRAHRYKIDALYGSVNVQTVEENDLIAARFSCDMFRNLNTPQDVHSAARPSPHPSR